MIQGFATPDGTKRFTERFATKAKDFYSKSQGLFVSSLGLGTYVGEPYREENYLFGYFESVKEAISDGCNFLDTAINYRYQTSEREIGAALKELIGQGVITRDEVVVGTKGGFLPLDYPFPKNPYHWIKENVVEAGLAKDEDIALDQHCMEPDYLRWSVETSLANLGLETVDIFYLHNPETQLGVIEYPRFLEKIEAAFAMFEHLCLHGKMQYYGVATWNGFVYEPENLEFIKLADLVRIAEKVGGTEHRFRFVQMPYNLAKPHAYSYTNQQLEDELFYTPIQAAKKLGLDVVTSSALLQMHLFKRPFNQSVGDLLGLIGSDVQKALQFARSASGISVSLFGSSKPEHVRHNFELLEIPKTPLVNYEKIFKL